MKPISRNSVAFTLLLGAISALPPLGVDMNLPALPVIAAALHTPAVAAGGTLSSFLLGFAMAPLVFNPISDRLGRRPVLLAALSVYTGAGLFCAVAPSIGWLLAARFFQGMGAGVGSALPMAIVRDLFEGAAARARLSYVTLVFSIGPLIAPALGSMVIALAGWRTIYLVLAGTSGAVLLAASIGFSESLPPARRQSLDLRLLAARYRRALTHRTILGFAAVNGCSFACMFAFISGSPLVLITGRGYGGAAFSAVLACGASGLIGGSLLNGWLARRGIASARVIGVGLSVGAGATITLAALSITGLDPIAAMLPLLMLGSATYGLVGPNALHEGMQPQPEAAGVASSVLRLGQIVAGALASALVPLAYGALGELAMTGVMACFAVASLLIYWGVARGTILRAAIAVSR